MHCDIYDIYFRKALIAEYQNDHKYLRYKASTFRNFGKFINLKINTCK